MSKVLYIIDGHIIKYPLLHLATSDRGVRRLGSLSELRDDAHLRVYTQTFTHAHNDRMCMGDHARANNKQERSANNTAVSETKVVEWHSEK